LSGCETVDAVPPLPSGQLLATYAIGNREPGITTAGAIWGGDAGANAIARIAP
jgi:hypothetical protein